MSNMSILIHVRQLALYMPALMHIENHFYPYGKALVVKKARLFQAYLYERGYFPDELMLPDLGQFVIDLYSIGAQVTDYNINLLYSYESPYPYNKSRIEELRAASKQQDKISELAHEFLDLNRSL